jgi:hypothetical protein
VRGLVLLAAVPEAQDALAVGHTPLGADRTAEKITDEVVNERPWPVQVPLEEDQTRATADRPLIDLTKIGPARAIR